MRKKQILCLVLALCALLLTACQQKETFSTELPTPTPAAAQGASQNVFSDEKASGVTVDYDDGSYDPSQEEDLDGEPVDEPEAEATPAMTFQSEYAGATPALIDPIDKPTPTPLPQIVLTYAKYEAAALHMSFEAPAGWTVNDEEPDTYTLTNPDPSMDFKACLKIRAVPVNKQLSKTELKREITDNLDTLSADYRSFSPSKTAGRTFLGADGLYATFSGTTNEGAETAGRVMVVCVNKTLYILTTVYPYGYRETSKTGLYDKFRHTVKLESN